MVYFQHFIYPRIDKYKISGKCESKIETVRMRVYEMYNVAIKCDDSRCCLPRRRETSICIRARRILENSRRADERLSPLDARPGRVVLRFPSFRNVHANAYAHTRARSHTIFSANKLIVTAQYVSSHENYLRIKLHLHLVDPPRGFTRRANVLGIRRTNLRNTAVDTTTFQYTDGDDRVARREQNTPKRECRVRKTCVVHPVALRRNATRS